MIINLSEERQKRQVQESFDRIDSEASHIFLPEMDVHLIKKHDKLHIVIPENTIIIGKPREIIGQ